jgi:hypothetical protein
MTAATLRTAAQDLLADHRYRQAAAATRAALDGLPDIESAGDPLESLAGYQRCSGF